MLRLTSLTNLEDLENISRKTLVESYKKIEKEKLKEKYNFLYFKNVKNIYQSFLLMF